MKLKLHSTPASLEHTSLILDNHVMIKGMKGLVSKENVVLRRWGSSIQKFWFYQRS